MNVRWLRSFMQLASCGHYGLAAAQLHLTQSTLSKQIQALEQALGVTLFERGRHGAVLTDFGRLLQQEAAVLLAHSEQLTQRMTLARSGQLGTLRMGFGLSTLDIAPHHIALFCAEHPQCQVTLNDLPSAEQHQRLQDGRLDLGFCRAPGAASALRFVPLFQARLVLVTPEILNLRWPEDAEALNALGFIALSPQRGAGLDQQLVRWGLATGFVPRVRQYADDILTIHAIVAAGLGVALLPALEGQTVQIRNRQLALTEPEARWPVGLCWHPDRPHPLRDRFISQLQARYAMQGKAGTSAED